MARITVSIPDDLEARLDAYATEKGLAVSHVVAEALRRLLDAPGDGPPTSEDLLARAYLEQVAGQLVAIGRTLNDISDRVTGPLLPLPHPPPVPMPPPPWRRE